MSLYHGGGSRRLRHISTEPSEDPSISSANFVLTHVPPAVVSAETAATSDHAVCAAYPTPPNSQTSSQSSAQGSSSDSTNFSNSNNVRLLSYPLPPPLIKHVEFSEQPSLETTTRLCHAEPLSAPPQLIPIELKTEPETLWHATHVPWPLPPNASGEESGVPVSRTTGLPEPPTSEYRYAKC